jgi:lipoprotein signal peptidase
MLSRWLFLSALVIVLDQISKLFMINHFANQESLTVLSVFDLALMLRSVS